LTTPLDERRARDYEDVIPGLLKAILHSPRRAAPTIPALQAFWRQVCRAIRRSQTVGPKGKIGSMFHRRLGKSLPCSWCCAERYEECDRESLSSSPRRFTKRLHEPLQEDHAGMPGLLAGRTFPLVIEAVAMIARTIAVSTIPRMKKNVISPMTVISATQHQIQGTSMVLFPSPP